MYLVLNRYSGEPLMQVRTFAPLLTAFLALSWLPDLCFAEEPKASQGQVAQQLQALQRQVE